MRNRRGRIDHVSDERGERMRGRGWSPDPRCPALGALRVLTLPFIDFAGDAREGELVVAKEVAEEVLAIFELLHHVRFPIRCMEPIEAYGGDDEASMAADNTSAFNFRTIPGSNALSHHALGLAIDINPRENPMIVRGVVHPASAAPYVDRTPERPGMILESGDVVAAFRRAGWFWGGEWTDLPDYHHFSKRPRG
jgi:hypothetical protein